MTFTRVNGSLYPTSRWSSSGLRDKEKTHSWKYRVGEAGTVKARMYREQENSHLERPDHIIPDENTWDSHLLMNHLNNFLSPIFDFFPLARKPSSQSNQEEVKLVWAELRVWNWAELQLQSFQWKFRVDFLYNWLVCSPCCPRDSQESSPEPQVESINSWALSLLYVPTLTSIHDYWKSYSFDYMEILWAKWCLCFLIHCLGCHGFLSKEQASFISWLQSLQWFWSPRK